MEDDQETQMTSDDLREQLDNAGDEWRTVWMFANTDETFDDLYIESGVGYEAMLHEDVLLVRTKSPATGKRWVIESDEIKWLSENPPFDNLVSIAALYEHSQGIQAGASPWLLFQYLIGTAVTSQGMGLNSLMGIGYEDAKYLGEALVAFGENDRVASSYIELLLMFGAEEG